MAVNNNKIEQMKRLIYKEIVLEDESEMTTEFRTQVEKAIFKMVSIMEGK